MCRWVVQVNTEPAYDTFLHVLPTSNLSSLAITGDITVTFVGFGPENMEAAPPIGFNLTYRSSELNRNP